MLTAPGVTVNGYACDMCDAAAIKAMHASVIADLGDVDVVVNNAGTSRAMPFMDITDELWEEDLELKLMGAVRLIRLTFPGMMERKWGRIINVLNSGAKAPRANEETDLDGLVDISITTNQPIVITDQQGNDVGVVSKARLLAAIQGGK